MRLISATMAGVGMMIATTMPAQVAAEAKIYPYHGANYCPAGYQPVQIAGVICCGQPNQNISYTQALAHSAPVKRHVRKKRVVYSAKAHCPDGTKGCAYD